MTTCDSPVPRFHLAMPVDGLAAARHFYGEVLGLAQPGRRPRRPGAAFRRLTANGKGPRP